MFVSVCFESDELAAPIAEHTTPTKHLQPLTDTSLIHVDLVAPPDLPVHPQPISPKPVAAMTSRGADPAATTSRQQLEPMDDMIRKHAQERAAKQSQGISEYVYI